MLLRAQSHSGISEEMGDLLEDQGPSAHCCM